MIHDTITGTARPDHYQTLGVARTASSSIIREGWKSASLQSHPDKGGSAELFARVQEAYKILSNLEARRAYDETIGLIGAQGGGRDAGLQATAYGYSYAREGVRVEVHGQVERGASREVNRRERAHAGQPSDGASSLLSSLTANIERRHRDMVAHPANRELVEALAEAYLDRAELHIAAGRRSHASFDAHEARLLRPDRAETRRRLDGLSDRADGAGDVSDEDAVMPSTDSDDEW